MLQDTLRCGDLPEVALRRSRRRRTIAIQVVSDGSVVVLAPANSSGARIQSVLDARREWVLRKVEERRRALALVPPAGFVPYMGQSYPVRTVPGAFTGLGLLRDEVVVTGGTPAGVRRDLETWYRAEADRAVRERLAFHARRLGLTADRVVIRGWKTRWGDCQRDGSLRFNWRLVMLPAGALDYVVSHELTHLREFNHSPRFWRLLSEALPEARAWRAWFSTYGPPYLTWTYASAERS